MAMSDQSEAKAFPESSAFFPQLRSKRTGRQKRKDRIGKRRLVGPKIAFSLIIERLFKIVFSHKGAKTQSFDFQHTEHDENPVDTKF